MRLQGKVAIVTGGARGLGASMCQLFAQEGATVIAADLGTPSYEANNVEFYSLNVADPNACLTFFETILKKKGKIDILVNNAGITRDSMTYKMTDEMWDQVIDVDLKGLCNLTRYIGPQMEKQGSGAILNISSVVGDMEISDKPIMPQQKLA